MLVNKNKSNFLPKKGSFRKIQENYLSKIGLNEGIPDGFRNGFSWGKSDSWHSPDWKGRQGKKELAKSAAATEKGLKWVGHPYKVSKKSDSISYTMKGISKWDEKYHMVIMVFEGGVEAHSKLEKSSKPIKYVTHEKWQRPGEQGKGGHDYIRYKFQISWPPSKDEIEKGRRPSKH